MVDSQLLGPPEAMKERCTTVGNLAVIDKKKQETGMGKAVEKSEEKVDHWGRYLGLYNFLENLLEFYVDCILDSFVFLSMFKSWGVMNWCNIAPIFQKWNMIWVNEIVALPLFHWALVIACWIVVVLALCWLWRRSWRAVEWNILQCWEYCSVQLHI